MMCSKKGLFKLSCHHKPTVSSFCCCFLKDGLCFNDTTKRSSLNPLLCLFYKLVSSTARYQNASMWKECIIHDLYEWGMWGFLQKKCRLYRAATASPVRRAVSIERKIEIDWEWEWILWIIPFTIMFWLSYFSGNACHTGQSLDLISKLPNVPLQEIAHQLVMSNQAKIALFHSTEYSSF